MKIPLYFELTSQIKSAIYSDYKEIAEWKMVTNWEGEHPPPSRIASKQYLITSPFGGYDRTVWFTQKLRTRNLPRNPVLLLDIPDALLFINGEPWQGIDVNHQEVLLTPPLLKSSVITLAVQAYSGRKNIPSHFNSAFVASLNREARALYHGLTALHSAMEDARPEDAPVIRGHIERALGFFASSPPGTPGFIASIRHAAEFIAEGGLSKQEGTIHLIPHSHIDVVWLWTLKETRRKCGRTFSTMLRLMDEFENFTFTQSQAVLYEYTRKQYPALFNSIKKKIKEGRWCPVGGMWVEPDCNIPNGESLVRQILYGKTFFKREFGIESDTLWLPDTFGYSWALPQILRKSGIKYFFTTKLTWNDTNKFPHNSFWWEGIDGTRILSHIPPVGLEGMVDAKHLYKSWREHRERDASPEVMQTFGFGDGGGGPTKQHIDAAAALQRLPEIRTKLSTVNDLFQDIEKRGRKLPVWRDELYLELHRGTYTTHGWIKKANREAERDLYNTELLCALASLSGAKYPAEDLEHAWKLLLLNQFHDIVPGTAIADAYADTRRDFAELLALCNELSSKAIAQFVKKETNGGKNHSFVVFNSLSWERSEYVTLRVTSRDRAFAVYDTSGQLVEHQVVSAENGYCDILCFVEDLPAFGFRQLNVHALKESTSATKKPAFRKRTIESMYYKVQFSRRGTITSLYDKVLDRELLSGDGNELQTFHDLPKQWEAWEIDNSFRRKQVFHCTSIDVIETGPLRATVRVMYGSKNKSSLAQDIHLYHRSRNIDFVTRVQWHEERTMLKVAFPFNIDTDAAVLETQFGAIRRPTRPTTALEKAKFEVPVLQWADLSDTSHGVNVLNDGKYGCDISGSTFRLTLIRSPRYPHPVEPWWLQSSEATDQGEHLFTYALCAHAGDWKESDSPRTGRAFNTPLLVFEGTPAFTSAAPFTLASESIMIDSVKRSEDGRGLIIRMHEMYGKSGRAKLEFVRNPRSVFETDLMENPVRRCIVKDASAGLSFRKFEIKTLKIQF